MGTPDPSEIEITPERASRLLADGAEMIDVREADEREASRIAGTRHIALGQVAASAETIDRDRPVIFQCQTGSRSAMAASAFRTAGYEAYNLSGGIVAWAGQGLPIEPADAEPTEH